jgi:hypothetical protein
MAKRMWANWTVLQSLVVGDPGVVSFSQDWRDMLEIHGMKGHIMTYSAAPGFVPRTSHTHIGASDRRQSLGQHCSVVLAGLDRAHTVYETRSDGNAS